MRYLPWKMLFHSISPLALPMLNGASNPAGPRARPLLMWFMVGAGVIGDHSFHFWMVHLTNKPNGHTTQKEGATSFWRHDNVIASCVRWEPDNSSIPCTRFSNMLSFLTGVGGAVRFLVVGTIGQRERPPRGQLWMEQCLTVLKYWPI